MYQHEAEQYCCGWTIKSNFPFEGFTKDGESAGVGRFIGLDKESNTLACQLWFVHPGFKIRMAEGYSAQIDPENKTILLFKFSD